MQPACLVEDDPESSAVQQRQQELKGRLVQPTAWGRRSDRNLFLLEDGLTVTYAHPARAKNPLISVRILSSCPPPPQASLLRVPTSASLALRRGGGGGGSRVWVGQVVQADQPFSQLQDLCYFEVILADVGSSECVPHLPP
jgi:hypothetical protein